ncbi:MAG: hypothetical protein EU541_02590 [Promethearchaeota archaeon]|nr:MAG: hypothetical protein EU541_02590 [Candidatus Lokiarchaeota archaeon]
MTLILNKNVIILCAGKGTRFGKLTNNIPKPLIQIEKFENKPILFFILNSLAKSGFKKIWIIKGYLGSQLETYISSLNYTNMFPELIINTIDSHQDYLLGPLHSLLSIRNNRELYKQNSLYFVIPGDTIFQLSLLQRISYFIKNHSEIISKYPILFYRTLNRQRLTKKGLSTHHKSFSILQTSSSNPNFLEKIEKINHSNLEPTIKYKQLYPCFLFTYSSLKDLTNIHDLKNIPSITRLLNRYSEQGKKIYITTFNKNYDFYDLDYKNDLKYIEL